MSDAKNYYITTNSTTTTSAIIHCQGVGARAWQILATSHSTGAMMAKYRYYRRQGPRKPHKYAQMTPLQKWQYHQEVKKRWPPNEPNTESTPGTVITNEEYNKRMAGAVCTICEQTTRRMYLDHCHKTGQIRMPLCASCNSGLGMFKDHIGLLKRAIAYIEYFERQHKNNSQ